MNIVVVGHGWIAGKMMHALRHHNPIQKSHTEIIDYLNAKRPRPASHWVVNCAGVTGTPNVDQCEYNKAETIFANAVYPILLSDACRHWNARLLHFSSGCIFTGGEFSEDSTPNFEGSTYSASKLVSDVALQSDAVVCRIRMPFDDSQNPKNLLEKIRHYALTGKVLHGWNSLSDADEMCQIAADLVVGHAANGVYHLVNKGAVTTTEIVGLLGLQATYWDEAEFAATFPAPRSQCRLTTKLDTTPVRIALARAIDKMKVAA